MIQGTQWPSFILQGIILGSDIYLISHAGLTNTWVFLSILCILSIFSLQATTSRFIYLFPVIKGTDIPLTYWDTHLLRLGIMLSASFLYIAVQQKYPVLAKWWFIASGIFFVFVLPLIFNFCLNKKIEHKLRKKYQKQIAIEISDNQGNRRGTVLISNNKLIWSAEKRHEISLDDLISMIENR